MLYQILPRYDYRFQPESMQMFLKTLSGQGKKETFFSKLHKLFDYGAGVMEYQFIIDCDGAEGTDGMISFYLQVSNERNISMVYNSLQNMFQDNADVFEVEKELPIYTTIHTLYANDENRIEEDKEEKLRLSSFQDDKAFLFILGTLKNKTRITIDFSIRRDRRNAKRTYRGISTDVIADAMIKVSAKTKYQRNDILEITNTIIALTAGERELHARYRDIYKITELHGMELMNLLQIPTFFQKPTDLEIMLRIHKLEIGQRTLKDDELQNGICCGKVYHPMQERKVYIDETQLRKHMFVTGQTGSGKSSVVEEMMRDILKQKVENKRKKVPGFSFFDPAETSALGVIDMLLKLKADGYDTSELEKKVHYIDFGYDDCVFPISLLNKDVPATEILDFFKALFGDAATIQVDCMVTSAINTLLMDNREYTIMDVPRLFRDEEMREELYLRLSRNVYAEEAKTFLKSKFNPNQIDPILNRTDPFVNTPKKKLMFGMHSEYDGLKKIGEWIDNGHIILFNLKGLNDNDRKIIIGYIALKYYLFGLRRNDNAVLHLVFMDESHKTQFPILQRWLAELRKSGLALVPMTQYLEQYRPDYLQALLGNVGTKISFRQGDDSARRLVSNLPGNLDRDSLKRLPDRIGYISTEDNRQAKSVLIEVSPPYRYNDGKIVPHPDPGEKATRYNIDKNRKYARELMERDFLSKCAAEKIVFQKVYNEEEEIQIEEQLLEEGDSLWDD